MKLYNEISIDENVFSRKHSFVLLHKIYEYIYGSRTEKLCGTCEFN